jgi:prephenate dehydrogenase
VVLALPLKDVIETLKIILPDLRENVVIMDTAPIKSEIMEWAKANLPANRHYIGLVPAINPAYLRHPGSGQDAAHADLFEKGLMGIISMPGVPGEAIKLASDFTRLLGASPMFLDLAEADGLMSMAHILPQLMAAALTQSTINQPGWVEMRKLAGQPYAMVAGQAEKGEFLDGLPTAIIKNRQNMLRVLNRYLQELITLRDILNEGEEAPLSDYLSQAHSGYLTWVSERGRGDWAAKELAQDQAPSFGTMMKRMFVGERPPKKK